MRRLIVAVLVIAAVLVGLDRLAVVLATRELASRLQSSQSLASRPGAAIRGFPFLTQVLRGRYDEVDVDVHGLVRDGVPLDDVRVAGRGVQVNLSDALHGRVRTVPVQSATGAVTISYAALDGLVTRYAARGVTVSYAGGDRLHVGATLSALGLSTSVGGDASVRITGGHLVVEPLPEALAALHLPSAIASQAARLITLDLPLPSLPYGLRITGGSVGAGGVTATAGGNEVTLPVSS